MKPLSAKQKNKAQLALSTLRDKNGQGACWNCKKAYAQKSGREGYTHLCKRCAALPKPTDLLTYEKLKRKLGLVLDPS